MIAKWSIDIPFVYAKGHCRYWQPETIPNFETSIHAHTLGIRLAWDPTQDPASIVSELHERFYGSAATAMAAYWEYIDGIWVDTPEYAGGPFGHLRRWPPERLAKSRLLLDAAVTACRTETESRQLAGGGVAEALRSLLWNYSAISPMVDLPISRLQETNTDRRPTRSASGTGRPSARR